MALCAAFLLMGWNTDITRSTRVLLGHSWQDWYYSVTFRTLTLDYFFSSSKALCAGKSLI